MRAFFFVKFIARADPTRRAILSLIALHVLISSDIAVHHSSRRKQVVKHVKILTACELMIKNKVERSITSSN
jgi:DNA-binding transcriptional ArsR family regulator